VEIIERFGIFWITSIGLYSIWLYALSRCKKTFRPSETVKKFDGISLVVPFKNEAKRISDLLQSLNRTWPHRFPGEVIFIDDYSTDNSAKIIKKTKKKFPFQLLEIKSTEPVAKRTALETAIRHANFPWILTLDADVSIPGGYFEALNDLLSSAHDIVMILGPVKLYGQNNFLFRLQQLENRFLQALTRFSADCDSPWLANGAHLIFRKKNFFRVNGYDNLPDLPGGDDIFLLEKFNRNFPGKIRYWARPKFAVRVQAAENVNEFIRQHTRWAVKTKKLKNRKLLAFSLLQSAIFLGFWILIAHPGFWITGNIIWFAGQYYFIKQYEQNSPKLIPAVFIHLVYPFFYVWILIQSLFFSSTRWR